MTKVLFVEDDPILGQGLKVHLELAGFAVDWCQDLKSAKQRFPTQSYEIVVLDLGLPDGSGLQLLQDIRNQGANLPVLILTAQTDEGSVVHGLELGANDYVRKPFSTKELLARLHVLTREPSRPETLLRFGPVVILRNQRKILIDNKEFILNRREYDIFSVFVENAERVLTRAFIIEKVIDQSEIFDRTVDSHISHIRQKLKKISNEPPVQINSVYGVGYRLERL
jgi:DNA-binding response OmpR family regulator